MAQAPRPGRRAALAGLVGVGLAPLGAAAQDWPSRPVRLVVPFTPGGSVDFVARLLAERLPAQLRQPVIVDNRPGGATTVGAANVAVSPPDGYSLLYGTPNVQIINPWLMASLPYDPARDFAAVVSVMRAPNLLAVHPSLGVSTVQELITLLKSRPGQYNYASSGIGTTNHLSGELLKMMAGVEIVHVPYRGYALYIGELLAGRIHMAWGTMSDMLPHTRSGALKAIAVTTGHRVRALPDVPATSETLPGYEASPFNYIAAPAGTPRPILARLNEAFNRVLADPKVVARMAEGGNEAISGTTPEETEATIRKEAAQWRGVIQAANIRPE